MQRDRELLKVDWLDVVRDAVRSGVALQGHTLLVDVSPLAAFHPLHALLPSLARDGSAVLLVTRLHARVARLLQRLEAANLLGSDTHRTFLESLVFVDRVVDVTSASAQQARSRLAHATPLFSPREVAVSGGAMSAFAADEAHAKAALADITRALQTCDDTLEFLDVDDKKLVVLLEHDSGYVGQQFDGRVVTRTIRVEMAPFHTAGGGGGGVVTLDSVLEAYEDDFRDLMEFTGVDEPPQRLGVSVRAAFSVSSSQPPQTELAPTATGSNRVDAVLLSSWGGIENVRSLGCKPPPNSSSLLCIGAVALGVADARQREVSVAESRTTTFQRMVQKTVAFLATLESAQSSDNSVTEALVAPELDDAQHAQLARKFGRFVSSPDAAEEEPADLNNTLELTIALDFDRATNCTSSRADLDFLEKTWDFAIANAGQAEEAVVVVRELVATFASARTAPFVHVTNVTLLGKFFAVKADAMASEDSVERLRSMQLELSNREQALRALAELGEWKLHRDVAAWLVQIGFTASESARVIEQFQVQQEEVGAASQRHRGHMRAAIQQLVNVCALAHSLGASGLLLRKLANDFLGYLTRVDDTRTEVDLPTFVVQLGSFIPERIRASLGGALTLLFYRCARLLVVR